MSEIVERVARAIYYSRRGGGGNWDVLLQQRDGQQIADDWRAMARAAIKAVREPNMAMVDAMCETVGENRDPGPTAAAWYAMIDAALSEPGSPVVTSS